MRFVYPVMLDVSDRLAVVIGGGAVAVRKVKGLLEAGARDVLVVSPVFHPEMPSGIQRTEARYDVSHLAGAGIVFAATDSKAVNDAVVRDCQSRGIWVNRADQDEALPGDFSTLAQLKKGPITVTVSAGSPALTATIRDGLADRWDERWTAMAELMRELRPMIVAAAELPQAKRAEIFRWLAGEEALALLATGGTEQLKAEVQRRLS